MCRPVGHGRVGGLMARSVGLFLTNTLYFNCRYQHQITTKARLKIYKLFLIGEQQRLWLSSAFAQFGHHCLRRCDTQRCI